MHGQVNKSNEKFKNKKKLFRKLYTILLRLHISAYGDGGVFSNRTFPNNTCAIDFRFLKTRYSSYLNYMENLLML